MVAWLESLPLAWTAVVVIGGFMLYAGVLIALQQRLYPSENFLDHLHAAGFIHAIIGIIYAVVLGFVAVGVWERFDSAEALTFDETGHWQVVYQDASALPIGSDVRKDIREYMEDVTKREWPRMNSSQDSRDPQTAMLADRLHENVATYAPKNQRESNAQQDMLANLGSALIDRNARTVAYDSGVHSAVWFVIFVGGLLTIAFSLFFGFKRRWLQYAMVCSMAGAIGLAVFMTLALDYPFRGDVSVQPEAFESTVVNFDTIDKATVPLYRIKK